jgi:hypothetical protein
MQLSVKYFIMGNDHLTEIHLIEIVIFQLIEIFNN